MYALRFLEEGGSEAGLGGYVWVALFIFFLMVFLGWLAASKGWLKKEEEPVHDSHHDSHGADNHQKAAEHNIISTGIDDLEQLEGIGPKVAKVLAGIGITTFSDLAHADLPKIKAALDGAGYKYMDPSSWIEQAVLAQKGDMAGLEKLQKSLKGGRKVA